MSSLSRTRILKELSQFKTNFNYDGIKLTFDLDEITEISKLDFEMIGPEGTPFLNEKLKLEINLTDRYTTKRIIINKKHKLDIPWSLQ